MPCASTSAFSTHKVGLAYADSHGRIYFDDRAVPLADGGVVREPRNDELIPAPPGTVPTVLPGRNPVLRGGGVAKRRVALGALLPAGYTRLLLPAYVRREGAPTLPLFGYAFACERNDELYVAAVRTDESDDWSPRTFAGGDLESLIAARIARDPSNATLAQLAICAREYACFTAQNVFLQRGEAALPVSPRCNARCVGCISEQDLDAGFPSPQTRVAVEADADALSRIALEHLAQVPDGIVSFGQGCEGEPLLRSMTIARVIETIRNGSQSGTININTNGSLTQSLARLIDAGLHACRISLNSFRPQAYAAYYRPLGYDLDDVLASVRLAVSRGIRVSLNLLTHPGVTDDVEEVAASDAFLSEVPVAMIQTRTLNIDPAVYFERVGRPQSTIGMRAAIERIGAHGVAVGNFTHTH